MRGHLQAGLLVGTADGALDETVGVGLGGVNFGILASVLGALVPAEVCEWVSLVSSSS
jgi:hypothetical protein